MKKDIRFLPVNNVKLAIAMTGADPLSWKVYLINNNEMAIQNIMITSKGYNESQTTSTLRHAIELLEAESFAAVESIREEVFHLTNEFWVSYYIDQQIYDKKFIFPPDSIQEDNLSFIEILEMGGILHA